MEDWEALGKLRDSVKWTLRPRKTQPKEGIDLAGGHKMTDDEIREALRLDFEQICRLARLKLPSTQRTVKT